MVLSFFQELGLQLNIRKSMMTPIQRIQFTGAYLDLLTARTHLLTDRSLALSNLVSTLQGSPQTSVRNCVQLLGHMAASTAMSSHARLPSLLPGLTHNDPFTDQRPLDKKVMVPLHRKNVQEWWNDQTQLRCQHSFCSVTSNNNCNDVYISVGVGSSPQYSHS